MELKAFKTLEERVVSLLNDYSRLKSHNRKIDEELEKKRIESYELSKKIERTEEAKGKAKKKVDHLLEKIEAFKGTLR
jgi:regulator of replication initiation timing